MMNFLFLFVLCSLTITCHGVDGRRNTPKEELINTSPITSINTKFGYIVDCVDINKQPAFDHPLLKNHKLQSEPSFNISSVEISPTNPKFEIERVTCPIGTVPIKRITKDDVIRAKSLMNADDIALVTHGAGISLRKTPSQSYFGLRGITNIFNPRVYKGQSSSSHLYVQGGQNFGTNKIMVGWHVNPTLYGDDATYIFSAWTSDNFNTTGCYNTACLGFVQKDNTQYMGARISVGSTYGGGMVEMEISLQQDPVTKNWWLFLQNTIIGYFPFELFPNLNTPDQVGWGGETKTPTGVPSPPMGSSYNPDGLFDHACYFRNITYRDPFNQEYGPKESSVVKFNDAVNCYGVQYYPHQHMPFGDSLQFGGPGGAHCADH